jgi:hypothetical protein
LEARTLLAASTVPTIGSPSAYQSSYQYRSYMTTLGALDQYTTTLARIEHRSKATAAEALALRDDARAIGAAISASGVAPSVAAARGAAISNLLASAPIDGWFDDQKWADEQAELDKLVAGLGVSESLVTQTIADMRAFAESAGVSKAQYYHLTVTVNAYKSSENNLSYYYGLNYLNSLPDAHTFYTQHLTGFVPGSKSQARADRQQLAADERALVDASGANAAQAAALRGGIHRLELAETQVPSDAIDQLHRAIATAFASGKPGDSALAALRAEAGTIFANAGAVALAQADGAITSLASYARATEAASAPIDTVLVDAARLVEEGAVGPANPYRVAR